MNRLEAKTAVVTGAGTQGAGIGNGKACAIVYAREGAKVLAVDIDFEAAQETARLIRSEGGVCEAFAADVSKSADCQNAIEACVEKFGRVDVLHNNVGITNSGNPVEYGEDDWDRMMNINVKSMFLTAKHALPYMERQGSGSIVNIGSINGVRAIPFPKTAYAASKAAVIGLSREIAIQYAAKGIRCNVVLVGLVRTPIVENNNVKLYGGNIEEMWRMRDRMSPTGKQGEAWDVAHACLFLASDDSKYVNGVVLPVDGGLINMVKL
ncbi:SDR family NAD(P)-dependent oxidoreductase [Bradyrhizobium sp. McL0615]|uniref:SDR family NAD(P)-dependent oxidoreductase n=1 Tax=Bradyrhizobium sp. McL0615 TaxID=3415673 RepID=UPI003CF0C0B2